MQAHHSFITDSCVELHGDDEALEIALGRLRDEYRAIRDGRKGETGLKFNFLLTLETGT